MTDIESGYVAIGKKEAYIRVRKFILDNVDGSTQINGLEMIKRLNAFLLGADNETKQD